MTAPIIMSAPNILDEKGLCKHCKQDAQAEFMECWLCQNRYHVIGCDGIEPMIQPSFLRSQWPTIRKKYPSLNFTCASCTEDAKTRRDTVMSSRVRLLEESSLETNNQLLDIKNLLTTVLNAKSQNIPDTEKPAVETPTLIVVEKADHDEADNSEEENKAKWNVVAKAAINIKAGVKNSWTNRSGQTVLVCNSEKSKQALLPHVQKVFTNRTINTPKPRLPTISVPFIHGKFEKEELRDILKQQNEDCGIKFTEENTQILFIAPMRHKENLYQAVIRVSEDIRAKIKNNGDRLFIGINSCPVYDRFFVKRCNHCQDFNHFHKDDGGCKKKPVCALCAGSHDTRSCSTDEEYHQCANCIKAKKDDVSHAAYALQCPMYLAEQNKLKKSINFYSKNL